MDTLLELAKLGSVGIFAGLFSSFITNRNHRHKKWWEMRVTAYQELIEGLSDLNHYFKSNYNSEIENQSLSGSSEKELRKYFDGSIQKIRIAADSGAFLYSEKVNESLNELMVLRNANHDTWFEYLDENLAVTEKCLKSVVSSSKTDLQVKRSWLEQAYKLRHLQARAYFARVMLKRENNMVNEDFLSDIKTLFESFRNIGICAALTLGLPYVEKSILEVFGSISASHLATAFFIVVILIFYIFNLTWLFCSLKVKPKSKAFFVLSSIIIFLLVTISISFAAFDQVWNEILIGL